MKLATLQKEEPEAYPRYVQTTLCKTPVQVFVNSGNTLCTAISLATLKRVGLNIHDLEPMAPKTVGTADAQHWMRIHGQASRIKFGIQGCSKTFTLRPLVIEGLSNDVNLSGPFLCLQKANLDFE